MQDRRTVRALFEAAAAGEPLEAIARRMNAAQVPGPWKRYKGKNWRSGRTPQWTCSNVKAILVNRAYLGELCFAKRAPEDAQGKRRRAPVTDWVVVENAWPALVDRELFDRVAESFQRRSGCKQRKVRYVLTGFLRCRACGSLLQGGGGTRPNTPNPERYVFYKCPQCTPRVTVNRGWLEDHVVAEVTKHVRRVVRDGTFDRVLNAVMKQQRGKGKDERADVQQEYRETERERERLVDAVADGTLKPEEARPRMERVRGRLPALEAELQRGRFRAAAQRIGASERRRLRALAFEFPARIAKANPDTVRELLGYWVAECWVDCRKPTERTGSLILRKAPVAGFATEIQARPTVAPSYAAADAAIVTLGGQPQCGGSGGISNSCDVRTAWPFRMIGCGWRRTNGLCTAAQA